MKLCYEGLSLMKTATLNAFAGHSMMTFGPPLADNLPVTLLITGRRHEQFLDPDEWRQFSPCCRSFFDCAFCHERVVIFGVAGPPGQVVQSCRCTTLKFEPGTEPLQTEEQWTGWQAEYLREQTDPAPVKALQEGVLTGTLDQKTNDWLSRHGGFPSGLQFHPASGRINAGEAVFRFPAPRSHSRSIITTRRTTLRSSRSPASCRNAGWSRRNDCLLRVMIPITSGRSTPIPRTSRGCRTDA